MFNPGLANVGKYIPSGQLPTPMFNQSMAGFIADTHHHNTMDLWHQRLAHASESKIEQMAQQGFIPPHAIRLTDKLSFCNSCAAAAATRVKTHRKNLQVARLKRNIPFKRFVLMLLDPFHLIDMATNTTVSSSAGSLSTGQFSQ